MKVCLVVATRERKNSVKQLLRSIKEQNHDDIRVVIVDQSQEAWSEEEQNSVKGSLEMMYIARRGEKGLSKARNIGILKVDGEVVGFPDDDCVYPPGLLKKICEMLKAHPHWDGISIRSLDHEGKPSGGRWHRKKGWVDRRNVMFRCSAPGLFLRRWVVENVGKFDELLGVEAPWGSGEELDYVLRALRLGARIWYEPGLYVIHPRREPGLRLIRRAYRYGKGIGRVLRKHRYSIVFSLYMIARPFGGAVGSLLLLRPGSAVYYLAGAAGRLVGLIQPGPLEEVDKVTGGVEVSSLMSSLNAYRMSEVLDLVAHALSSHRGYIVTPNTDHVVRYHRDPAFRKAVDGAWLRLADGMPVVWASRLVGNPLPERVAGSDLLPELCRLAAERAYSVFFLGGRAGVARQAAENLKSRYRGLKVAGTYTPVEGFAQDPYDQEAAVEAVNRTEPDILFVGLGSPVQELWVHRNWDRLRVRVAVCCGAALDYAAGTQPRAPWWMRRAGLEWLWRLVHEPRRLWRRYLVDDLAFFGLVLQAVWAKRVRRRG